MSINSQKSELLLSAEREAAIEAWINSLQKACVADIINHELLTQTAKDAIDKKVPLPLILTLCPAVRNLDVPNSKGQTRELIPLSSQNKRLSNLLFEVFGFQTMLLDTLKLKADIFLVFADKLEKGSENMFVNPNEISHTSELSVKAVRDAMIQIDQSHPGFFQKKGIKIPKVRLQSSLAMQGGKIGQDRDLQIQKIEMEILNPNSNFFELWSKHLKLARNDSKFTETSWQGLKSAETIWKRMRFLIAELITDGLFLPQMMKHLDKNQLSENPPEPIFLASSTRKASLTMEADCFNAVKANCLIPAFRNIGKWTNTAEESPWIEIFKADIIDG